MWLILLGDSATPQIRVIIAKILFFQMNVNNSNLKKNHPHSGWFFYSPLLGDLPKGKNISRHIRGILKKIVQYNYTDLIMESLY